MLDSRSGVTIVTIIGCRCRCRSDVFGIMFTHSRYWYHRTRYLLLFEIEKFVAALALFVLAGLSKVLAAVEVASIGD